MSGPPWNGRHAQKARDWCKANLGWVCWLCNHPIEEGDYSVDHIVPRSVRPDLTWDQSNWRPAHLRSHREYGCPGNTGRGNGKRKRQRRPAQVMPGW